jgi:hypothetical protein
VSADDGLEAEVARLRAENARLTEKTLNDEVALARYAQIDAMMHRLAAKARESLRSRRPPPANNDHEDDGA